MGLGSPTKRDSLVAESRNMSTLGGADHARAERWNELELPLSDFMMGARHVLRRSDSPPTSNPRVPCPSFYAATRAGPAFVRSVSLPAGLVHNTAYKRLIYFPHTPHPSPLTRGIPFYLWLMRRGREHVQSTNCDSDVEWEFVSFLFGGCVCGAWLFTAWLTWYFFLTSTYNDCNG